MGLFTVHFADGTSQEFDEEQASFELENGACWRCPSTGATTSPITPDRLAQCKGALARTSGSEVRLCRIAVCNADFGWHGVTAGALVRNTAHCRASSAVARSASHRDVGRVESQAAERDGG
jgi:hypothetical protein